MRVRYTESVTQWVYVDIPETGLIGEDLEEAAREAAFETIQEDGWHGTDVLDTTYEGVK